MSAEQQRLRAAVTRQIVEGPATTSTELRRAAHDHAGVPPHLEAFLDKVVGHAYRITDADVDALKHGGMADDAIFELAVCAAVGEASRQLDAAMRALDAATAAPAVAAAKEAG